MDNFLKKARKVSGLARWERTHRQKAQYGNRKMLAYNVPGTQLAGTHSMMINYCNTVYDRLRREWINSWHRW